MIGKYLHYLRYLHQTKSEHKIKDRGLKILINGGYGVFGYPGFKYYDKRVAELITAYGRHTLRYMQQLAEKHGFEIVAGDTDSLFLSGGNDSSLAKFISDCQQELGVEVEHEKTYAKFANIKKKHYIGIDSSTGKPDIKGTEGKKSDRPRWVNYAFDRFVQDFKNGTDPTLNIRKAVTELESGQVDPERLKIWIKLSKNLQDYTGNHPNKKIGMLLGAKAGDVIWYFKTDDKKAAVSIKPEDIGITKYKEMLMATMKEALEILGYGDSESIASEVFGIKKIQRIKKEKKTEKC